MKVLRRVCPNCGNLTNKGKCDNCMPITNTERIRIMTAYSNLKCQIVGYLGESIYVRFKENDIAVMRKEQLVMLNGPHPGRQLSYLYTTRTVTA